MRFTVFVFLFYARYGSIVAPNGILDIFDARFMLVVILLREICYR